MEKYITAKEVADMVKLSEQTIRRYVMLGQIPFYKIVRAVRFKPCEIEKWVEERRARVAGSLKTDYLAGLLDDAGTAVADAADLTGGEA